MTFTLRRRRQIVDLYVDGGSFEAPFFNFFDAKGKPVEDPVLDLRKTYRFHRLDGVRSHPFYLSDTGVLQKPSRALHLRGEGDALSGISGDEVFKLRFRKRDRRMLKDEGRLIYFCSAHPSMTGTLAIKGAKRSQRDAFAAVTDVVDDAGFVSELPLA